MPELSTAERIRHLADLSPAVGQLKQHVVVARDGLLVGVHQRTPARQVMTGELPGEVGQHGGVLVPAADRSCAPRNSATAARAWS